MTTHTTTPTICDQQVHEAIRRLHQATGIYLAEAHGEHADLITPYNRALVIERAHRLLHEAGYVCGEA